jgi:hypothetical protein
MLNSKYPKFFKNKYDNLEVENGSDASLSLDKYYKTYDKRIKDNVEEYNEIDCIVMKELVEWLNEME